MLTQSQEFERLESYIEKFDSLLSEGKLDHSIIEKCQKFVDKLDARFQIDSSADSESYRLFEMQGLIYLAEGKFSQADEFINEAKVKMPSSKTFISHTIKDYMDQTKKTDPIPDKVEAEPISAKVSKYSGKLEGWLALYALRIIVLPLVFVWDIISTRNLLNGVDTTSALGASISSYETVALVGDLIGIILACFVLVVFFTKNNKAKEIICTFEAYIAIYYLVFTIWISNILSSNNINDNGSSTSQLTWGFILGAVWFFYWMFSKRVKATFVSE